MVIYIVGPPHAVSEENIRELYGVYLFLHLNTHIRDIGVDFFSKQAELYSEF